MKDLVTAITSSDPALRDQSIESLCREATLEELVSACGALDRFRRSSGNLYERVRALFFLYAIHRFHIPLRQTGAARALIPFSGYENLLKRRFEEAIDIFLADQTAAGPERRRSPARWRRAIGRWASRLWPTRCGAAFARCAATSGCSAPGIRRTTRCAFAPSCCRRAGGGLFPVLREATPVRMDLTHSGWSDIFFLGMDFPEGARVLNISIDLTVRGGQAGAPKPPVEALLPGDRSAGAATGQRGPQGQRRNQHASPRSSISRATTWAC